MRIRAPGCAVVVAVASLGCGEDGPLDPERALADEAALVAEVAVPRAYGLHDTHVRDGVAFLSAWNTGVIILDVGNGVAGGTPEAPVEITRFAVPGVTLAGHAHNTWWFHDPATGEARYLFVGQEGPGTVGSFSSGDILAYDISDLAEPVFVGAYHRDDNSGAHNFWLDEDRAILYAAYYNGGVVALDVAGTLPADLTAREVGVTRPAGPGATYVWGVMLGDGGALYASDMVSGLWRLSAAGGAFAGQTGGFNVPERFTSDLWVHGEHAYTGTWGFRDTTGNVVKVWSVAGGAPALVDSIVLDGITTVSDLEVSADGALLLVSAENGPDEGLYLFDRAASATDPPLLWHQAVPAGVHTTTFMVRDGRTYVCAARNPGVETGPALLIYDVTGPASN